MKVELVLDDDLMAKAMEWAGNSDVTVVIHAALRALIEREAARRLAGMGGLEPNLA